MESPELTVTRQWGWVDYLKSAWIVLQATAMAIYMVIGVRHYNRVQIGWTWTKSLFVMQTFIIAYLVIFEFGQKRIQGMFVILLLTSYGMFLTFCIVVDSCRTE